MKLKYQYMPREEMQSVLDIVDFPEDRRAQIAYQRFVKQNNEVLYIERMGVLIGVVSIGDLERYYANKKDKLEINRHFSYANRIDERKAAEFFARYGTFFEFPVVDRDGRLEGVMKIDTHYDIRMDQIASLVVARYLKDQWHRRELARFLNATKARVVLYYKDESAAAGRLTDRKSLDYEGSMERPYLRGLPKQWWEGFVDRAEDVPSLKREFGNFHTKMVRGVSELVDMEGDFYNCIGGRRVTCGNPEKSDRRVIFYGSCTLAGAYCKDAQTIQSYFQQFLNQRAGISVTVINKALFNMFNFFSRMMTDELCEQDIVVFDVVESWLTDEIRQKCEYVGDLTSAFLEAQHWERDVVDKLGHCNYRANERIARRIYRDFEVRGLLDDADLSDDAARIQDYYIGSEIMSEVLLYMERCGLLPADDSIRKGAMALLVDPFTDRHRRAVETALRKVDVLYLFVAEDSNLTHSLEERVRVAREAVADLEAVVVLPAGKYLYTKKISRAIRKGNFCDDDMEYDCDIFGEIYGGVMGVKYRFIMSELENPVERKYMDMCRDILPRFGVEVEEL